MKNTNPVVWLIAMAVSLAICSPTALGKTRGHVVMSNSTLNYEIGKDVKPGVDGLITSSDTKAILSLVTLQQGNDGSATILYIIFKQESSGAKKVSTPVAAGRIMLEPATAGSTTRQGVMIRTMEFDPTTGKWTEFPPDRSPSVALAFVPDIDEPDPFPVKPGFNAPRELGSVWAFTIWVTDTIHTDKPDRFTKIDDHKWRWEGGGAIADLTSFDGKTVVWTYTDVPPGGPDTTRTTVWTGQLSDDFKTMTGTLTLELSNGELKTHDSKKFTAVKQK